MDPQNATAEPIAAAPVAPVVQKIALTEVAETLYAKRKEIYPRARISDRLGWFQKWRWVVVWLTQLVFYGIPWLSWNGRQAVLFDLAARKFYLFGLVLWPQDIIFLTALLIISALSLFLFTAVGGRLWCGYACPQTVYTEIFMWIERRIEGDRAQRMALDRAPLSAAKLLRKSGKHGAWIAVSLWTGFTFVGYFTPIRDFGSSLLAVVGLIAWIGSAGAAGMGGAGALGALGVGPSPWEGFWTLFYGFATYGNAGWMREQVCKYMCPYARFQSAMFDRDTLIVTYDAARGERRAHVSKKSGGGAQERRALGLGDCIDCSLCVQVCPTGIDIRDGLQYECIGCAACIDACNYVMDRAGMARGLIRYATARSLAQRSGRRAIWRRLLRPRVLIYGGILGAAVVALATALALRVPLRVDVIRDRGALAREVEDRVENVYRLQVMNATERPQRYLVQVSGLPQLAVASASAFEVAAASTVSVPLRLQAPAAQVAPGPHRIVIEVTAAEDDTIRVHEKASFLGLRR